MAFDDDTISNLNRKFQTEWKSKVRPWIADYLKLVTDSERVALLQALVPVDIACRRQAGEAPNADDYIALGAAAVDLAERALQDQSGGEAGIPEFAATQLGAPPEPKSASTKYQQVEKKSNSGTHTYPEIIGPYKLLTQIGKGGMGTVWEAQQEEPVRRRVAIKLIRGDLDSGGAIVRFAAERQAIALMDHQNIARILDAGTTDSGTPFFVMELVDGIRLDHYCDKKCLDIRERLELMVQVCRAIQHAHNKGIIHRDLKPSNVLVADYDGKPVPKVIDFGLAKALDRGNRLTEETVLTEFGQVVGTLQYMSPEQAVGTDIDTRTDIYSLGVLLYKLLTGCTPIGDDALSSQSFLKVVENIQKEDPPRPSARMGTPGESLQKICRLRKSKPDKLVQIFKGDLDWIVMKALEKDRGRRYETANGLAVDIERYLNDDEVSARPPSNLYRLQKFVRRNRGLVTSLAVFAVMLIVGMIGTGAGLIYALDARDRALVAESEAREAEERARVLQLVAEAQLRATRMKSAWSDWQMGNIQSAWKTLRLLEDDGGWESRFLRTEFTASEDVLYGHSFPVVSLDVSDDGRFIATAGRDHIVRIWDAGTHRLLSSRQVPGAATCVCFAPNSTMVACSDLSNCVSIWNVEADDEARVIGPFLRDIRSMAFCGSEDTLVIAEDDIDTYRDGRDWEQQNPGPVRIVVLSTEDGAEREVMTGHTRNVTAIACSKDGTVIVTSSRDNTVRAWTTDAEGNRVSKVFIGHTAEVNDVDISPSGTMIASCGSDKAIRVWDLETGLLMTPILGHDAEVSSIAFSGDGERLVSAGFDRSARIWTPEGKPLVFCRGHFAAVNDACFSVDGDEIITCSDDQTVRIWKAESMPGAIAVKLHPDVIWQAACSADDQIVVSVSESGQIARAAMGTGELLGRTDNGTAVLCVDYSPVGDVFATGDARNRVRIWRGTSGEDVKTFVAHKDFIWDVSYSPDGKRLVTASSDRLGKIWDTTDWSLIGTLTGHTGELASARFSPDGTLIVTSSDDMTVRLWDANTFEELHCFDGHANTIWRAVFSPSGAQIVSSGFDGELFFWDVKGRKQVRKIRAHSNQIAGLAFSPDGSRLVTASDDATIKVWDVGSGIELFVLRDQGDSNIVHVSFSTDGSKLISGNARGWLTIRSANDYRHEPFPFLPEDATVFCIDGLIAVTAADATVDDFEREFLNAVQCCRYYPSYRSWIIRGICEYRLGNFEEARTSLMEAGRLEPIQYGEPDQRPFIEGFLAMACLRLGRMEEADQAREIFDAKSQYKLWLEDETVLNLVDEVSDAFAGN